MHELRLDVRYAVRTLTRTPGFTAAAVLILVVGLTGTIAMAGGRSDRAVMVGDSEVDIATAAAAGVPSIGVTFGYTSVPVRELKPTAVIDHYGEFMEALGTALG